MAQGTNNQYVQAKSENRHFDGFQKDNGTAKIVVKDQNGLLPKKYENTAQKIAEDGRFSVFHHDDGVRKEARMGNLPQVPKMGTCRSLKKRGTNLGVSPYVLRMRTYGRTAGQGQLLLKNLMLAEQLLIAQASFWRDLTAAAIEDF